MQESVRMNMKFLTLTMAAASIMLTSVTANAWSNDHRNQDHRNEHRYTHKQMQKQYINDKKHYKKQQIQRHKAIQKAAKKHYWQRGQYIPVNYRAPRYVVNDWRAYHLSAPVRGNEWRRIDGRYVQVSRHNHRVYRVW